MDKLEKLKNELKNRRNILIECLCNSEAVINETLDEKLKKEMKLIQIGSDNATSEEIKFINYLLHLIEA